MAGHELIEAQLAVLSARLPARAVDELADGLWETYQARLALLGDGDAAAREAIAEFGDADAVTAAFVRDSPWRRMALALLATGPVMAALWGASLVSAPAWAWQIPAAARIAYGLALLAIVATLLAVTRARHAYGRARRAVLSGAVALLALDTGMLVAVASMTSSALIGAWLLPAALAASLVRIIATLRALPAVLGR
ncbi:hypothetical protein [Nonomuraea zeae]|uniref:Uncharacterized protein n=1 Tax=Nonomuraea zeae TaxID=1642303 RepID=A0A5S4FSG4_9ACTN|nr:hypothetical protein [Nonomuraea zeae]TMR23618.1 hypothetical protein ETD85_47570 [Nonomuraea zeae]